MTGQWTVEYLETGGPGPRQLAGWYATTQTDQVEPKDGKRYGLLCTFAGPFDSEDEAKQWVRIEKGVEPIAKVDHMRELGKRVAMERNEAFWRAFQELP